MITVRKLNATDAFRVWHLAKEFIVTIFEKAYGSVDEAQIKPRLVDFKDWSYGLFHDDKMVGVLAGNVTQLFLINDLAWYEALFLIEKPYRGKALKLINFARADLKSRGIKYMTLGVADPSKNVRHLYKKLGYKFLDAHYIAKL